MTTKSPYSSESGLNSPFVLSTPCSFLRHAYYALEEIAFSFALGIVPLGAETRVGLVLHSLEARLGFRRRAASEAKVAAPKI